MAWWRLLVVGVEEVQVDDSQFGEPGGVVGGDGSGEVVGDLAVEDSSDTVEPSGGEVEVPSAPVPGTVSVDEPEVPVRVVAEVWPYGLPEEGLALIDPGLVGADGWFCSTRYELFSFDVT